MLSTLLRVEGYHIQVYDGSICRDEDCSVLRRKVFHWWYLFIVSFSQNRALRCLHSKTKASPYCGYLVGQ